MNNTLVLWPLVVIIEDCHIPELAAPLLEGLRGLSAEEGAVTLTLWAYEAEGEMMRN